MEYTTFNDGELISDFVTRHKQEAFEEIVRRHGALVLGVCRSVLGNVSDVEDAAQAAFMALAQKGASLRDRKILSGWLHRVAWYAAGHQKRASAIRLRHEREAANMRLESTSKNESSIPLDRLHGLIAKLPEKYLQPIILHHLEGRSEKEVANLLDSNVGTIAMRLNRDRQMLRDNLSKAGSAINAKGGVAFTLKPGATIDSQSAVNDGRWHHVLAEANRTGKKLTIYIDGKKDSEAALSNAVDASLANTGDFLVGKSPNGDFLAGAVDLLRVCRGTLADARTDIDELYTWEFHGPASRDFCGNVPDGKRDAGAIQLNGKPPTGAVKVIESRQEQRSETKPPITAPPAAKDSKSSASSPSQAAPSSAAVPAANDSETVAKSRLAAAKVYIASDPAKAKDLLRKVVADFPDTQAAKDARQELGKLN